MIDTYLPVLVMLIVSAGFVISIIVLSIFTGPKRYSEVKDDPFECGTVPTGDATERFSVKFYLVAVIFILFDIEIVFLYPWAVRIKELGWYGFAVMLPFLTLLIVGLAYEWKRGVLDWK